MIIGEYVVLIRSQPAVAIAIFAAFVGSEGAFSHNAWRL